MYIKLFVIRIVVGSNIYFFYCRFNIKIVGGMLMTLYSNNCPKCKILKEKLDSKHIQYILNTNVDEMIEKGFTFVPVLEVSGKYLNFAESLKYIGGI